MNNNLKIVTFVAGLLSALVAVFYLVSGIIELTHLGDAIAYSILNAILLFAVAAGLCYSGYVIVKGFLNKEDRYKVLTFIMLVIFCGQFISSLLSLILGDITSGWGWAFTVLALIGLILVLVSIFVKLDDKNRNVATLCAAAWGFVFTIVILTRVGGLSIATYIFVLLLFITILAYTVVKLVENSK